MSDPTRPEPRPTEVVDVVTGAGAIDVVDDGEHRPAPTERHPDGAGRFGRGLVVVADLFVALGAVVGFNQLATQSPVDAVLPVALFSVGMAGLVTFLAGLVGTGTRRGSGPPRRRGPWEPPSLDGAFTAFALGLVALVAVLGHWGVAALAALVGVQGLRLLLQAEEGVVAMVRRDACDPEPFRLGLTAAEAVVLLVFAVAALADGGVAPFG